MKTFKSERRFVVEIDEVRCNKCGELLTTASQEQSIAYSGGVRDWFGLVEVTFTTGYHSDVLPDGTRYTFSLCEPCVKELMDAFKLPAEESHAI